MLLFERRKHKMPKLGFDGFRAIEEEHRIQENLGGRKIITQSGGGSIIDVMRTLV